MWKKRKHLISIDEVKDKYYTPFWHSNLMVVINFDDRIYYRLLCVINLRIYYYLWILGTREGETETPTFLRNVLENYVKLRDLQIIKIIVDDSQSIVDKEQRDIFILVERQGIIDIKWMKEDEFESKLSSKQQLIKQYNEILIEEIDTDMELIAYSLNNEYGEFLDDLK